jgi:hypothetical protein
MKARSAKPAVVTPKKPRNTRPHAAAAPNAALNQQNRRVLAQHYRAKYGVK